MSKCSASDLLHDVMQVYSMTHTPVILPNTYHSHLEQNVNMKKKTNDGLRTVSEQFHCEVTRREGGREREGWMEGEREGGR